MVEQVAKIKKKRWFPILAPKILGEREIGESYVTDPNNLVGRVIPCNLMIVTNDIKHQNTTMKFLIKEIKDNKALTEQVYYELTPNLLRRLMRRGKDRIDESFAAKTADNIDIRIKLFVLTNSSAKSSILAKLRNKLKEATAEIISKNKYDDIFDGVIRKKVQKDILEKVKKIFPIKICEVRILKKETKEIIKEKKPEPKKVEEPEEKTEKIKKEEKPKVVKEEKQTEQKKPKKKENKKTKKKNASTKD